MVVETEQQQDHGATASGVPVTRIYCVYRYIHLPQLLASPSIWHSCIFVDKMVITQRSEQYKKGTLFWGFSPAVAEVNM